MKSGNILGPIAHIKKLFMLKEVLQIDDLDSAKTYSVHRNIILSKPVLKDIYWSYFKDLFKDFDTLDSKKIVEIGAGAYNTSEYYKKIITSDIEKNEFVDMAVDAQNMPFKDNELDGIVMLDTLHHIKKPGLFFDEAYRTLKNSGLLVMIEPYFSLWSNFVYRHLHHEPVIDTLDWDLPEDSSGRLSGANILTPYNIFIRDRELFESRYPGFKFIRITKHSCFNYLLSGGLSYKCLLPTSLIDFQWKIEKALKPLYGILATNMTLSIRKA